MMKISMCGAPAVVAAATVAMGLAPVPAAAGGGATPWLWQRCSHLNTKYHHGVGKRYAHDRTTGTPVTNFCRSTRLYNIAMSYNKSLDRDKDGIAGIARAPALTGSGEHPSARGPSTR